MGNIRTLTSTGGGTETFTYDWLNRLSTASAPSAYGSIAYTYDEVGNRITKVEGGTTTTYTYGMYNLLLSNGTWTFRYDPNLNQNWRNNTANTQKWNYQWNSLDQLTKVVKGIYASGQWTWTTIGEYSYDANGARAKTVESGTTIEYVFLGHNPMCEKTGTTYTDYVYVNGKAKEKLVGSNIYHYLSDPMIGSTWQVWKDGANSATFSVKCYKPFGTPYTPSGTEKVKYAGEIQDASTGLYYIFARYMDPELGRFISLDPQLGRLSSPQSMNRYVYCVNNPLRFVDPTGKLPWVAIGALIGAGAGIIVYAIATPRAEWSWEGVGAAALGGAAAGAVTALTFNPAWGAATWTAIAGGAVAGAAGGAAGGATEYLAEGGLKAISGKPFDWSLGEYYKQMGLGAGFGAIGGAAGVGVGKFVGKLFGRLVGQSYDDIMKGVSSKGATIGAVFVRELQEEMSSQVVEWFARRSAGLEDAIARYTAIGVFPEGFLTTQTTLAGSTEISKFIG